LQGPEVMINVQSSAFRDSSGAILHGSPEDSQQSGVQWLTEVTCR
jgi:hypothetical protein